VGVWSGPFSLVGLPVGCGEFHWNSVVLQCGFDLCGCGSSLKAGGGCGFR
jgi:hypothetical protein